jgi:hypothetical protein
VLRGFGLRGLLPGAAPADFRRLSVRNVTAVAHGHYKAELGTGEVSLPLEVELQQISSQVWVLRYALRLRTTLRVEQLELAGLIQYADAAGLVYAAGEASPQPLVPRAEGEPVLAEPAIWESLFIGPREGRSLRLKADGPILKALRLLDLRQEEDFPAFGVVITVAQDEELPAGAELKFSMIFDGTA